MKKLNYKSFETLRGTNVLDHEMMDFLVKETVQHSLVNQFTWIFSSRIYTEMVGPQVDVIDRENMMNTAAKIFKGDEILKNRFIIVPICNLCQWSLCARKIQ